MSTSICSLQEFPCCSRVEELAKQMLLSIVSIYKALMQLVMISEVAERAKIEILKASLNRSRHPSELYIPVESLLTSYATLFLSKIPSAHPLCGMLPFFLSFLVCTSICNSLIHCFVLFVLELCTTRGEALPVLFFFIPDPLCLEWCLAQSWCSINIYSNNKWRNAWVS